MMRHVSKYALCTDRPLDDALLSHNTTSLWNNATLNGMKECIPYPGNSSLGSDQNTFFYE